MARPVMSRRPARLSAALTCARVSLRPCAGSGALPSSSRVSGASRSCEGLQRGGEVLPQLVPQPLHLPGPFPDHRLVGARQDLDRRRPPGLSPAAGRSWWESVRTMSASTCASPASLLAPDTPCRSRNRAACSGFTGNTRYPAATSAATHGPRSVSIPTSTSPSSASSPRNRRPGRAAARSRPRPPAAACWPAPSRPRPSPRRRDGPQPSHHPRTAAPALPSQAESHLSSQRENHQRPNRTVLTPRRAGTTSQQRSTLPVTGRGTI